MQMLTHLPLKMTVSADQQLDAVKKDPAVQIFTRQQRFIVKRINEVYICVCNSEEYDQYVFGVLLERYFRIAAAMKITLRLTSQNMFVEATA